MPTAQSTSRDRGLMRIAIARGYSVFRCPRHADCGLADARAARMDDRCFRSSTGAETTSAVLIEQIQDDLGYPKLHRSSEVFASLAEDAKRQDQSPRVPVRGSGQREDGCGRSAIRSVRKNSPSMPRELRSPRMTMVATMNRPVPPRWPNGSPSVQHRVPFDLVAEGPGCRSART